MTVAMVKASPALLCSFSGRTIRSIGVPAEIKQGEGRVGMTPMGVAAIKREYPNVTINVLDGAGIGSDFSNNDYENAGAVITDDIRGVWGADMVVKVKEPLDGSAYGKANEFSMLGAYQPLLFTYLHLAADQSLASSMAKTGATGIAYETVQKEDGSIPMLIPMSIIAGMQAPIQAASLGYPHGAKGQLIYGVHGAAQPQNVFVIGGGIVGSYAATVALGLNARVRIADINPTTPRTHLSNISHNSCYRLTDAMVKTVTFQESSPEAIEDSLKWANTIIGAALIPGAQAPKLVNDDFFRNTAPRKVIVDVSIDQGGTTSQSHATTHAKPTYIVDSGLNHHEYGDVSVPGTVMYCVANMPGMNPCTATRALTATTLPYILAMLGGFDKAFEEHPELVGGINTHQGYITRASVAQPLGLTSMLKELKDF